MIEVCKTCGGLGQGSVSDSSAPLLCVPCRGTGYVGLTEDLFGLLDQRWDKPEVQAAVVAGIERDLVE